MSDIGRKTAALIVGLWFAVAAVGGAQGKPPARDTTKRVAPQSRQPPPPTVVRRPSQPPPPTVVRPTEQPPPPTVVRPSQQPPPPTVVRPSEQPPPPMVVRPSEPAPEQNATEVPCAAAPPYQGALEVYSIKYDPRWGMLVVSLGVDQRLWDGVRDELFVHLAIKVVDPARHGYVVNVPDSRLVDAKRFAPRDPDRAGVVLTIPWDGRDRSGTPLSGGARASYKAQLTKINGGARSLVGRAVAGFFPVVF